MRCQIKSSTIRYRLDMLKYLNIKSQNKSIIQKKLFKLKFYSISIEKIIEELKFKIALISEMMKISIILNISTSNKCFLIKLVTYIKPNIDKVKL